MLWSLGFCVRRPARRGDAVMGFGPLCSLRLCLWSKKASRGSVGQNRVWSARFSQDCCPLICWGSMSFFVYV